MATALASMPQVCPKTGGSDSEEEAVPGVHQGLTCGNARWA
jgi:hypothetical protein